MNGRFFQGTHCSTVREWADDCIIAGHLRRNFGHYTKERKCLALQSSHTGYGRCAQSRNNTQERQECRTTSGADVNHRPKQQSQRRVPLHANRWVSTLPNIKDMPSIERDTHKHTQKRTSGRTDRLHFSQGDKHKKKYIYKFYLKKERKMEIEMPFIFHITYSLLIYSQWAGSCIIFFYLALCFLVCAVPNRYSSPNNVRLRPAGDHFARTRRPRCWLVCSSV